MSIRIVSSRWLLVAAVATMASTPVPAAALPPETVWVDDLIVHPSGPAEIRLGYEHQASRVAGPADRHAAQLTVAVGLDRAALDFLPSASIIQVGDGAARIGEMALALRFRLAGTPSNPTAMVTGAYRLALADEVEHRPELGVAGRVTFGKLSLVGSGRLRAGLRADRTDRFEATLAAAATYGVPLEILRAGVEAFAFLPLRGERMSEAAAGPRRRQPAIYIGPTLRLQAESVWIAGSVVSGRLRDTGADLMTRVLFGVQL